MMMLVVGVASAGHRSRDDTALKLSREVKPSFRGLSRASAGLTARGQTLGAQPTRTGVHEVDETRVSDRETRQKRQTTTEMDVTSIPKAISSAVESK